MNRNNVNSRQQACYFLGVREDADVYEIRRAYHMLAKRYHPDINPRADVREYYIRVCESYEYLMQHPYVEPVQMNHTNTYVQRPSRIFQSDSQIREQYRKQKRSEEERKKQQKRETEARQKKTETKYEQKLQDRPQSKEEEILEKIRAIWLAETIKRQIALDKEKKDAENKRKLYQAFMQQKIQEEQRSEDRKL